MQTIRSSIIMSRYIEEAFSRFYGVATVKGGEMKSGGQISQLKANVDIGQHPVRLLISVRKDEDNQGEWLIWTSESANGPSKQW